MQLGDTIISVASPPGRSKRGLIRLSGPDCRRLLGRRIWKRGVGPVDIDLASGTLPALAVCFAGPNSYSGEDVTELLLPGNPDLMERVIEHFVERGARRAERGEFSARGFLSGRMSLSQAEGVAHSIRARSDAELAAANQLLDGELGQACRTMADELASMLALVEAEVDFTDEEDVIAIAPDRLIERAAKLRAEIRLRLDHAVGTERLSAAPWVVLLGPANAGKSTLFNALLERIRAVASPRAGATRDVLVEPMALEDGGEIMLVDLAGVAESTDLIMRRAADARTAALGRADLVLRCRAAGETSTSGEQEELRCPVIDVTTKADLGDAGTREGSIVVSAHRGLGLDTLRHRMTRELADRTTSFASDAVAMAPRHEAALRRTLERLESAVQLAASDAGSRSLSQLELVASELRSALDALGEIVGQVTPDDVLGRVFSEFCIGK
jgi:tRNA modification GTPase